MSILGTDLDPTAPPAGGGRAPRAAAAEEARPFAHLTGALHNLCLLLTSQGRGWDEDLAVGQLAQQTLSCPEGGGDGRDEAQRGHAYCWHLPYG